MIKANELRIGNIFKAATGDYVRIDLKHFAYLEKFLQLIEPVPLTPEILEKCGFEKDKDFASEFGKHYVLEIPVTGENRNEIYFYFETINNDSFGRASVNKYHASNNITYLHELQNLYFALTGEELTVNL